MWNHERMQRQVDRSRAGRRVELCAATARADQLERRMLLTGDASPFPEQTPSVPTETVLFVNYDNGGEGVSHSDADRRNKTREYRRKASVDLERVADDLAPNVGAAPGLGRGVGHTRAGEWLNYTVDIKTAGTYRFELRYASGSAGGTARLEVDGKDATGSLDLSSTGGWQRWRTLQKSGVALPSGQHTLRFVIDSGRGDVGNLHWFRFALEDPAEAPPGVDDGDGSFSWPSSWKQIDDAPSPRFESMSVSLDDKLYVFGGWKDSDFNVDRTYARFDPVTGRWRTLGELPRGMAETHIVPVEDGKFIYFAGGYRGDLKHGGDPTQDASDRVWRFDPSENEWLELPSLPRAQGAGGAAIVNGKIHFVGGTAEDRVTNVGDHFVMDLSRISGGWERARSMPDPKDHFSTVALNGKMYTIGGEYGHDVDFDTQASVHVYDPSKDRWNRLADLPMRLSHAEGSAFALGGRIVFAGGQTPGQAASNRAFAYRPSEDDWTELSPLPARLQGTSVAVVGRMVVVTQGARYTVQPLDSTYIGWF